MILFLIKTKGVEAKSYRRRLLIWPVVGILLLAAALLLFDFQAARSQTTVEYQMTTFSFGGDGENSSLLNQDLDLYVFGPGRLAGKLAEVLTELFKDDPHIQNVQPRRGDLAAAAGSVLMVRVAKADILWLPVYSRARLEISLAYASDGAVEWMDDEVVRSESGPFTVRANGHIEVDDRTYGLISQAGYDSQLSQSIGPQVRQAVRTAWSNTEPAAR